MGGRIEFYLDIALIGVIIAGSGNKPPWTVPAKATYGNLDMEWAKRAVGLPEVSVPGNLMVLGRTQTPLRALHYVRDRFPAEAYLATFHYLFHAFWALHLDLTSAEALEKALGEIPSGFAGKGTGDAARPLFTPAQVGEVMSAAGSQAYKDALKKATDEALHRGAFGCPWLWVTNAQGKAEPFFGSDSHEVPSEFPAAPKKNPGASGEKKPPAVLGVGQGPRRRQSERGVRPGRRAKRADSTPSEHCWPRSATSGGKGRSCGLTRRESSYTARPRAAASRRRSRTAGQRLTAGPGRVGFTGGADLEGVLADLDPPLPRLRGVYLEAGMLDSAHLFIGWRALLDGPVPDPDLFQEPRWRPVRRDPRSAGPSCLRRDLKGFPPTHVEVGDAGPLWDEARGYVRHINEANGDRRAVYKLYEGGLPHGFWAIKGDEGR
ncbi:hypothetical protein DL767_010281 [Monosporascus sp. MG133]|nr:hypothetical protein DL767_010281 [Monosporascus sp. MG133]